MKIKDLHGKSIEVTDLDKAIWQAEYAHEDQSFLSILSEKTAYKALLLTNPLKIV